MDMMITIMIVVIITMLLALSIWMIVVLPYKHKFRIRQITGTKTFIIDDKAKAYKDRDGVVYWRLWKMKQDVPVPPPDSVDIDKKGKFVVEAYRNNDGEIQYIIDNKEMKIFHPLTTNQRVILVHQIKKAEEKKGKHWTDYLMPIAGGSMVLIVFIMAFMFWEDITKPSVEFAQTNTQTATMQRETVQILQEIIQKKQMIGDYEGLNDAKPPD